MFLHRLLLLLSLGPLAFSCSAQVCTGFRGGSLSAQALKQEYGASIFTVDSLLD
jgi:hypothetical protein